MLLCSPNGGSVSRAAQQLQQLASLPRAAGGCGPAAAGGTGERRRRGRARRAAHEDAVHLRSRHTTIAELTDEEVRFYTDFKDRVSFLKYWGCVTAQELPIDP